MADECTGVGVRSQSSFRDNRNTSPPTSTTALMLLVALIMRSSLVAVKVVRPRCAPDTALDPSHTTTNNAANNRYPRNANEPSLMRLATERDRRLDLFHERKTPRHNWRSCGPPRGVGALGHDQ